MNSLYIDLETYASVDLRNGLYVYAEAEDTEILLCAVSICGGPVTVYDLAGGDILPDEILAAIADDSVPKIAHNASFERILLSVYLRRHHPEFFKPYGGYEHTVGSYLNPASWYCTMMMCRYYGLPSSLAEAAVSLKIKEGKMDEGKGLISYFCRPCRPTTKNGSRMRNRPSEAPADWELFKKYCRRDVEVLIGIHGKLGWFPFPETLWTEYHLSEQINDRGIRYHKELVDNAIAIDADYREELAAEMKQLTGLDNPASVKQLKNWLASHGCMTDSLDKKSVAKLLETADGDVSRVLQLRQRMSGTATKKYVVMSQAANADGRLRGLFEFYKAHTGRWSSKIVQLQNLPRNRMRYLDDPRRLVLDGEYDLLHMLYDDVTDTLTQLVRTALIPADGYRFIVADYSAIEARVLAFLAGETWRLEVFHNGGDIYAASAERMFKQPVTKELRQKGKVAELALGYGGGAGALERMGALSLGIKKEDLKPMVVAWRRENPAITRLWDALYQAAEKVMKKRQSTAIGCVRIESFDGSIAMRLPSGRKLFYFCPELEAGEFGLQITHKIYKGGKWQRESLYGGKLAENLTQAVARDILANAMQNLADYRICGHIHDELIIEAKPDTTVEEIVEKMCIGPKWLPGIELRAEGYEAPYYKKE